MTNQNNFPDNEKRLETYRAVWDDAAASFDDEPDHGLRDPKILAAWTALLQDSFVPVKGAVLDIGCGTGSLSLVLAGLGYDVTGIDFSPAMIEHAEEKAQRAGHPVQFHVMDAASPQFPAQHFDAMVCRHLLWMLTPIDQVLRHWVNLLKPGGRLLLIEGHWFTGSGLHAEEIVKALPDSLTNVTVQNLSEQVDLWGRNSSDERYAIIADLCA